MIFRYCPVYTDAFSERITKSECILGHIVYGYYTSSAAGLEFDTSEILHAKAG